MADTDEETHGDEDERGLPPTAAKRDAKKKHRDNMVLIGVAIVGVILTFLIWRSSKAKQTGTTTGASTSALGTTSGIPVGGSSADPYTQQALGNIAAAQGQQTTALNGLASLISTLESEVGQMQASPPPGTPNAGSNPVASPGYGYINLPGIGQSVILGNLTSGGYTGYEASGGAPVYFGNANAVSQGPSQELAGNYAYTPIAYAGLVSSSPQSGGPLPGQH